jgi:nucleoside-diphosphate-sugar epimerase
MASVLVTGANGFVGGYTVAAFGAAGWDVRGNDGALWLLHKFMWSGKSRRRLAERQKG